MHQSYLDRSLGEALELIQSAVSEFARDEILPRHEALDHAGTHPDALWGQLADLGLFGVFLSEDEGGSGAGFLGQVVIVETLSRAAGVAGVLPVAQGLMTGAIRASGQGTEHLEGLASGAVLGAPALAELDDAKVTTVAIQEGGALLLSGAKANVPFPGRAGLYLVRALEAGQPVLALVLAGASGLKHAGPEPVLGLSGFEVGTLTLQNTPAVKLGGADLLDRVLTEARIAVSALLAGLGRGALDHGARYATERQQFQTELRHFPAIQERLARSDARVESLRALVHDAARLLDEGAPAGLAALRARLLAQDVAISAADDVVQVYGGFGYSREYPAERFYRDARFPGFGEHHHTHAIAAITEALR